MSKIYTKQGDKGTTVLANGERVSKNSVRVQAYGEVDETNSIIGVVLSMDPLSITRNILKSVQHDLFLIGAHLATPTQSKVTSSLATIDKTRVAQLEEAIDSLEEELSPLRNFILPGGSKVSAFLHLARTVCRRAERSVVALKEIEEIDENIVAYLNRLSDLLFVLARYENTAHGAFEEIWKP